MRQISPKKGTFTSAPRVAFMAGAAGASTIAVDGSVCALGEAILSANANSGDAESTSVIEGVFFDGFESSDSSAWSQTVGGD